MTYKLESALWLVGASGVLLALIQLLSKPVSAAQAQVAPANAPEIIADTMQTTLDSIANEVVQHDPFRLARRPSQVPFIADTLLAASASSPKTTAPLLLLAGIVGGPPWAAIIEGFPGREGAVVVHGGDTLAGLRIRDVRSDRAIVSSPDTTWVLTIKRSWQ